MLNNANKENSLQGRKSLVIGVRVDQALRAALERRAAEEGRTLSDSARRILTGELLPDQRAPRNGGAA